MGFQEDSLLDESLWEEIEAVLDKSRGVQKLLV